MIDSKPSEALDVTRLCELARASADPSSDAFEQFAGVRLGVAETASVPVAAALETGLWPKGIFFEMEGELEGQIGILLSPPVCEAVATVASDRGLSDALDSMFLELGNIVASQTVSAIADGVSGRIVLSIPHLVTEGAERELAWRLANGAGATDDSSHHRVDATFSDPTGRWCALIVLAPDAPLRSV